MISKYYNWKYLCFLSHQTTLGCAVIQLPNLFGSMYTWITRCVFAKENSTTSIESFKTNEEHVEKKEAVPNKEHGTMDFADKATNNYEHTKGIPNHKTKQDEKIENLMRQIEWISKELRYVNAESMRSSHRYE